MSGKIQGSLVLPTDITTHWSKDKVFFTTYWHMPCNVQAAITYKQQSACTDLFPKNNTVLENITHVV